MDNQQLIAYLFRNEYPKIVAVLYHYFKFDELAVAEDIVSDTFYTATQAWALKGVPEKPEAWLYKVARNKAKNYLQHDAIFKAKVYPEIMYNVSGFYENEVELSSKNINDSQLRMLFVVCNPAISQEAQVCLALRILCGFGIEEIADALTSNKETINKRLLRAKEKLRAEKIKIDIAVISDVELRLDAVLTTIYLFFNEGYYSISQNKTLRKEICFEAMRLCSILIENEYTNKPAPNALLALMCFHASRFESRINEKNEHILYHEQNTDLWNQDLIRKGGYFLTCAAKGNNLSKYHLEAAIAYWNTQKEDTKEKWNAILQLYEQLLLVAYSPVAALNSIYALYKVRGKQAAIAAAEKLNLVDNHFFHTLLGELYSGLNNEKAKAHFKMALLIAKSKADKEIIRKKINSI